MARTDAEPTRREKGQTPPAASVNGTPTSDAKGPIAVPKAYQLTDAHGHRAYLWRDHGEWVLEVDDPAFRRRIRRGLRKPIMSVEDELDEFGVQWSKRVTLQPDDPRYANRLLWSWNQVGLDDVEVRVVRRHDRQPVSPRSGDKA
jgi:hypothetical protein